MSADEIWGPRSFEPYKLRPDEEREGGAREWIERALIAWYFVKHDNQPTPMAVICRWIEDLTPLEVLTAVETMARVGLP